MQLQLFHFGTHLAIIILGRYMYEVVAQAFTKRHRVTVSKPHKLFCFIRGTIHNLFKAVVNFEKFNDDDTIMQIYFLSCFDYFACQRVLDQRRFRGNFVRSQQPLPTLVHFFRDIERFIYYRVVKIVEYYFKKSDLNI